MVRGVRGSQTRFDAAVVARLLFVLVICSGSSVLYVRGGSGGDLEWVHRNLGYLVFEAWASSFLHSVLIAFLAVRVLRGVHLLIALTLFLFSSTTSVLLVGFGTETSDHGLYNFFFHMLLVFIQAPILWGVLWMYWKIGRRRMLVVFLCVCGILLAAAALRNESGRWSFWRGLNGVERPGSSLPCEALRPRWFPYDILPRRALNFFHGFLSCRGSRKLGTWEQNSGLLVVNRGVSGGCPAGQKADVLVMPITRLVLNMYGIEDVDVQRWVRDHVETVEYDHPFVVNMTNAVVIRCGGKYQLLIRFESLLASIGAFGRYPEQVRNAWTNDFAWLVGNNGAGKAVYLDEKLLPWPATTSGRLPHVVVVFIDSASRPMFHRRLPRTAATVAQFQKAGLSGRGPVVSEFFGYTAVGTHTSANVPRMFSGSGCMPTSAVENLAGLPEIFSTLGYRTVAVDGSCVSRASLTHTLPLQFDHELTAPWCLYPYIPENPSLIHSPFVGPFSMNARCFGGRSSIEVQIEYARRAFDVYSNTPMFMWLHSSEGHDPSTSVLSMLDEPLEGFVEEVMRRDDAVLMLVADHGPHMSVPFVLRTRQGLLENSLPVLITSHPQWVLDEIAKSLTLEDGADVLRTALRENQFRLLSHDDFFNHIVSLANSFDPEGRLSMVGQNGKAWSRMQGVKGISGTLFDVTERTCESLCLYNHFCACPAPAVPSTER